MLFLFWASLFLIFYTYFGFFAAVYLIGFVRKRPVDKADIEPTVSLIIAAYNEEKVIVEKLENSLRLDYPRGKLEIVVVTDGSSDGTPDVVRSYADRGVKLLHRSERQGKTMALNRAVPLTSGEIVFFSDANTNYRPDTVRMMVRNFHDRTVGGVSGRKIVRQEQGRAATAGEKGFWGYEATLKLLETLQGSISTADGEIFALRRGLFEPIPKDVVHDDMYLTLSIVRKGLRVVYEWDAVSEESASKSLEDEFHLKTRYASAGYQIVGRYKDMLLPPRGLFGVQFFSHKVLRWLAPVFLIALFVTSGFASSTLMNLIFLLQAAFYASAAVGYLLMRLGAKAGPLYFPLYFCMGNGAALYGILKLFGKKQTALWRKAER